MITDNSPHLNLLYEKPEMVYVTDDERGFHLIWNRDSSTTLKT